MITTGSEIASSVSVLNTVFCYMNDIRLL